MDGHLTTTSLNYAMHSIMWYKPD